MPPCCIVDGHGRLAIHETYYSKPGEVRTPSGAELWPKGDDPLAVAEQLKAMIWCPAVGEYVMMDNPERIKISKADLPR